MSHRPLATGLLLAFLLVLTFPFLHHTNWNARAEWLMRLLGLGCLYGLLFISACRNERVVKSIPALILGAVLVLAGNLWPVLEPWQRHLPSLSIALVTVGMCVAIAGRPDARMFVLIALCVFPLGIWEHLLTKALPYQEFIAWAAAFILQYLGQEVQLQGVLIIYDQSGVLEVQHFCSGIKLLAVVFYSTAIFGALYPEIRGAVWRAWLLGTSLGVAVSIIRVALLTVVHPYPSIFEFLHGRTGNESFTLIVMLSLWPILADPLEAMISRDIRLFRLLLR